MIGSGSVKRIIDRMININPGIKIATIDKDVPDGVCLIRGSYNRALCKSI
jgi:hypothetical protein